MSISWWLFRYARPFTFVNSQHPLSPSSRGRVCYAGRRKCLVWLVMVMRWLSANAFWCHCGNDCSCRVLIVGHSGGQHCRFDRPSSAVYRCCMSMKEKPRERGRKSHRETRVLPIDLYNHLIWLAYNSDVVCDIYIFDTHDISGSSLSQTPHPNSFLYISQLGVTTVPKNHETTSESFRHLTAGWNERVKKWDSCTFVGVELWQFGSSVSSNDCACTHPRTLCVSSRSVSSSVNTRCKWCSWRLIRLCSHYICV